MCYCPVCFPCLYLSLCLESIFVCMFVHIMTCTLVDVGVFYVFVQCWVCKKTCLFFPFLCQMCLSSSPKLSSPVFTVAILVSVCVFILLFVSLSFSRVSQCHQQTVSPLRSARARQEATPPHREELRQRGGAVMTKSPLRHTPMYVFVCVLVLMR